MVKFVKGTTNLVGNSNFLLVVLWSLICNFGDRISRVASDCLTKIILGLIIPFLLYQVIYWWFFNSITQTRDNYLIYIITQWWSWNSVLTDGVDHSNDFGVNTKKTQMGHTHYQNRTRWREYSNISELWCQWASSQNRRLTKKILLNKDISIK